MIEEILMVVGGLILLGIIRGQAWEIRRLKKEQHRLEDCIRYWQTLDSETSAVEKQPETGTRGHEPSMN